MKNVFIVFVLLLISCCSKKTAINSKAQNVQCPLVVFFDYDGTISDNEEYRKLAVPYAIKKILGDKYYHNIRNANPTIDLWNVLRKEQDQETCIKVNRAQDEFIMRQKFIPINGFIDFITNIKEKDIKTVVLSHKMGDGLRAQIRKDKMDWMFNYAYGSYDFIGANNQDIRKPSAEVISTIAKHTKLNTSKCWMVGDDVVDIETGISAKCQQIFYIGNNLKQINDIKVKYKHLIDQSILYITDYSSILEIFKTCK